MTTSGPERVVLDTSVLINFLAIDRVDLLACHPGYRFLITEHVRNEVTVHYQEQVDRLMVVIQSNALEEMRVESIQELNLFGQLSKEPRLGFGECAAIAAAVHRGHVLAIDDKVARKAALSLMPTLQILDTQALMVSMIRGGVLSVQDADTIKTEWASKHSFILKIRSFQDLLGESI